MSARRPLLLGAVLIMCMSSCRDEVDRFEIGRPATDEEIAQWDIDVDGEGNGLPDGSGDAETGRTHYAALCAGCHGASGEGSSTAPQLIKPLAPPATARRNIESHWPYAPPLFDYIRRTMPPDLPRSYGADTLYSLVAYLLRENGIAVPTGIASRTTLPAVVMPARSRFVRDDRRGGRELR